MVFLIQFSTLLYRDFLENWLSSTCFNRNVSISKYTELVETIQSRNPNKMKKKMVSFSHLDLTNLLISNFNFNLKFKYFMFCLVDIDILLYISS